MRLILLAVFQSDKNKEILKISTVSFREINFFSKKYIFIAISHQRKTHNINNIII